MARGARAENIPAAPSNENVPIASSSTFNDFDAEASLLALQKHVDAAAANGGVDTAAKIEQAFPQFSPEEQSANSIAYAASAALLTACSANTQTQAQPQAYPDSEAKIHPELRTSYSPSYSTTAHTNTNTNVAMSSAAPAVAAPPAASPQQAHAVPAPVAAPQPHTVAAPVAPQQSVSPAASQEHSEVITDGRKGPRRELSTSKRAAQNRAAQRAFRQRKEGYIKKLEQQVHDYGDMENQFKATQSENYALREYIIHLQSRLLDAKAELPQPPANVNLTAPGMPPLISMGPPAGAQQPRHQQMHVQPQQQSPQPQYQEPQHAARTPSPAQHAAAAPAAAQAVAAAAAAAAAAATNEAASPHEGSVPSDGKNDSSLARVAQAVAQLGNAANGAPATDHSTSNGVTNGNGAADTKPEPEAGEPMDTEEEAISQKVHKLSDPASS